MFERVVLCLFVVSTLMLTGCFITGRVVDENGVGIAGVTVTLSGGQSKTAVTDSNGTYWFGDLAIDDKISAGSYTVAPSKSGNSFIPASRNVNIINGTLEGFDVVPFPVGNVDFTKGSCGVVCLPKTVQTTCYDVRGNVIPCGGSGQDGDTHAGVAWPEPRFMDNGDGTVTDHLTGLIWLKNAGCAGKMAWNDALSYCRDLSSGSCGLTDGSVAGDWRLPNVLELETLINAEDSNPGTGLNSDGFTNVQSTSYYWAATTFAKDTSYAWIVGMLYGTVSHNPKAWDNSYYVWPVRDGHNGLVETWKTGQTASFAAGDDGDLGYGVAWPLPRFADNGDGTVTDHLTGLVWLKDANCAGEVTWDQALDLCNNLSSGSYGLTDGSVAGDWRLPNRKELFSLVDHSQYNPALPQGYLFSNVISYHYWSSTTQAGYKNRAWTLDMLRGDINDINKAYAHIYVWPVRDGQ